MAYIVREARPEEYESLGPIEASANDLLDRSGIPRSPQTMSVEFIRAVARAGAVFVAADEARDAPGGFLLAGFLDRAVYLFLMAVGEDHQRQGLGRRLMQEGAHFAMRQGVGAVTLSTYADVAWNAPFFETLGYRTVPRSEWTPSFFLLHARQRAVGLPVERRVFMRKEVG
jgi:predicted N-acetyltransferase YhbS